MESHSWTLNQSDEAVVYRHNSAEGLGGLPSPQSDLIPTGIALHLDSGLLGIIGFLRKLAA
jgi:hypothetical protein